MGLVPEPAYLTEFRESRARRSCAGNGERGEAVAEARGPRRPRGIDRRDFLRRSAAASLGLGAAGGLLGACGDSGSSLGSRAGFELARPNRPTTLPVFDDNPPIEDNLPAEKGGVLKIYNWQQYIWAKVVKDFSEKYGVGVEITTFSNMDEALPVVSRQSADFDLFFHRIDVLGFLIANKVLRPLNHNYIPNLEANVWPVYRNPFYDQGWRYTVPYTVYTTGIGWRADHVKDDIAGMENPYDIYWNQRYKGKINLFDDYREVVGMALLKNRIMDLNTGDTTKIDVARNELRSLAKLEVIRALDIDAYSNIPRGQAWIHQAYSGDMVSAQYYFPKGQDPSVTRYWAPPDGRGAVGSDAIGVLRRGRNPVLAHLFIDYLLDSRVAMKNFSWNGYQPPIRAADPERLIAEGYVPPNVSSAIVRQQDFNHGRMQLELSRNADALWHTAYRELATSV